jgi:hypothetical protein
LNLNERSGNWNRNQNGEETEIGGASMVHAEENASAGNSALRWSCANFLSSGEGHTLGDLIGREVLRVSLVALRRIDQDPFGS